MKETILELSAEAARNYFLQASRYCTIDLPKYFDFQPLLDNLNEKIGRNSLFFITKDLPKDQNSAVDVDANNKSAKSQKDSPKDIEDVNYKFLTNKDGHFAWRPLQIINPAIYVCLVNRITENNSWEQIKNRFDFFHKNDKINCYSLPILPIENDYQLKADASANILNWWEEIEQQSIELALQYNYVLVTDITDCYGSIYTHTIGWALHGKEIAREHRKENPPTLIGCIIDDIIQTMSYRQTNGIPQGSVLMDFIAEMVLGYADSELTKKLEEDQLDIDYKILRYRDDYRIFANTQENAVVIAKALSEVLSDINLRLNAQKTYVSSNIIRDVIKPDKLFWNEAKHVEKTLQKHLLLIHSLAEKHPNSGSLSTALSAFLDSIFPLKILKEDSSKVLVSILVDIAYNNPRTYSLVIVCIGKILSLEHDKNKVEEIYKLICKRFESKPNIGYWLVWFQRLTIKTNREKEKDSKEVLCKIAANAPDIILWNISWLKDEYQQIFHKCSIINEQILNETTETPDKNEVQLFSY